MAATQTPSAKDPSLHHLPPQNLEAEASLISAILIDNSALLDILEILTPMIFTDQHISGSLRLLPIFFPAVNR